MLEAISGHVADEWRVITGAPLAFVVTVLFSGALLYFCIEYVNRAKISTLNSIITLKDARIDDLNRISVDGQKSVYLSENTKSDAISLFHDESGKYSRLDMLPNGAAMRTLNMKAQNIGDGLLSDFRVFIKRTSPSLIDRPIVLIPNTPLLPGQYAYFPVARFTEKAGDLRVGIDDVTVLEHYGGGWAGHPITIKAPTPDNPLLITIEALASECGAKEVHFKLWVEPSSRRMRMTVA